MKYARPLTTNFTDLDMLKKLAIILAVLVLGSCAGKTTGGESQPACQEGYDRVVIKGKGFKHAVFRPKKQAKGKNLHIYIHGDGKPFITSNHVSPDPDGDICPVFELMALDDAPKDLLGRPCYNGLCKSEHCGPFYWTLARYSPQVVSSMILCIKKLSVNYPEITLIGVSGGGTLAVLAGQFLDRVTRIITMGANLDIETWARKHRYTPLAESWNPMDMKGPAPTVKQTHIAGGKDKNVPWTIIHSYCLKHRNAEMVMVREATHTGPWKEAFVQALKE